MEKDGVGSVPKEREWEVKFECPGDPSKDIKSHIFKQTHKAVQVSDLPPSVSCPQHPELTATSIGRR